MYRIKFFGIQPKQDFAGYQMRYPAGTRARTRECDISLYYITFLS